MLNTKYYKDLNHNYLIIKEDLKEEGRNYQHKMITSNRMKHLLECKIRYVDEESHFYYEISSKQSLSSLFVGKSIEYEQLRRFFEHMKEALSELENYMLDSRRLILQPEYIYVEPETEEYYFLYYPHYEEPEEIMTQMSLAQFLVDKVDHEQEQAVEVAYKVYEMMQDGQFVLSGVLDLLAKSEPAAAPIRHMKEQIEEGAQTWETPETAITEWGNGEDDENREEDSGESQESATAKHILVAGILMSICLVAVVGIFCLRFFMQLSAEENLFAMVGIGILTVVSAFLLLYLMFNLCTRRKKKVKKEEEIVPFISPSPELYIPTTENRKSVSSSVSRRKDTQPEPDDDAQYGNTIFLEASMVQNENKLYGTNKGNKYHIDLNQLPCTIGKMAGGVDVVIKDNTISRIHARFTRQEEGICVTDLNSTNGSFKNGLRLEPNETVLIEPGDELRFGRMTFCYR